MRRIFRSIGLGVSACLLCGTVQAEPLLRRVVLSSGGVGQFEFDGEVDGAARLTLDVPLDQVDDVLKSLTVDDPAGPFLGARLPGQQPLSESFRTLPFKPEAFASAEALLASLVGEAVSIPATGASGAILSVSPFELSSAAGRTGATRHRLTIATQAGLASVVLEDTPDIAFTSDRLRGQVAAALSAIAAQRVQDRRSLVLDLRPGGHRQVRFGYVVAVPVWKTSYRLTLPGDGAHGAGGGQAHLQAYAVVENLSGRDWHDVAVTLTSGRPVLFHTPLYQSVFATRPDAPVDVPGGLAPPVDAYQAAPPVTAGLASPAPSPESNPPIPTAQGPRELRSKSASPAVPPPSAIEQSVAKVEFRLAAPVTASSGQSLLLPILDRTIAVQRVALFQPESDLVHPLVALHLTNDGPAALPPGLVSLFDRQDDGTDSYVGDARLPAIQPGEDRLASFAVDLGVTVDEHTEQREQRVGTTIAGGVLTRTSREQEIASYRITTPKSAGRTVVVEQPRRDGLLLVEPGGEGVAVTPDAYRVTTDVPAGTTRTLRIVTERTTGEERALLDDDTDIGAIVGADGALPAAIKQALAHAAALRADVDRLKTGAGNLERNIAEIVADQARVRSNLAAVPANSDLQRRYLATLQTQETDLAALRVRLDATREQVESATSSFGAYVTSLKL